MADSTAHWSCVCPGGVCNGYAHTFTTNDLACLFSLYPGGTVLRKKKGVPICLLSSDSLPVAPAQVQTDCMHQSFLCVEGEHSDMSLTQAINFTETADQLSKDNSLSLLSWVSEWHGAWEMTWSHLLLTALLFSDARLWRRGWTGLSPQLEQSPGRSQRARHQTRRVVGRRASGWGGSVDLPWVHDWLVNESLCFTFPLFSSSLRECKSRRWGPGWSAPLQDFGWCWHSWQQRGAGPMPRKATRALALLSSWWAPQTKWPSKMPTRKMTSTTCQWCLGWSWWPWMRQIPRASSPASVTSCLTGRFKGWYLLMTQTRKPLPRSWTSSLPRPSLPSWASMEAPLWSWQIR